MLLRVAALCPKWPRLCALDLSSPVFRRQPRANGDRPTWAIGHDCSRKSRPDSVDGFGCRSRPESERGLVTFAGPDSDAIEFARRLLATASRPGSASRVRPVSAGARVV